MRLLAIETSCDETAAAVVEDGRKVCSSVIASQIEEHKIYGGVVPEIASRRHIEAIGGVAETALSDAGVCLEDIDGVAVTYAPGLIGALLVGVNFAKGLSMARDLPLIPVHHLKSHIAANYICHPGLEPPFLCLVVSGGHSHIIEVRGYCDFHVVGVTRDDAAGEAMDKAARAMGLPYPGGYHMDKMAQAGNAYAYSLPHPKVDGSVYDFSFSGLKTAALNIINKAKQKNEEVNINDLCASFQKTVVECLTNNLFTAAENLGYRTIVVAGGVCANSRLREETRRICGEKNMRLFVPSKDLCTDNAAMVGAQGYYEYLNGKTASLSLNACASVGIEGEHQGF